MNRRIACGVVAALVLAAGSGSTVLAQGTAITYQGQLKKLGVPVGVASDVRFTLYDAEVGGNIVGGPVTKTASLDASGLFSAEIDFGPSAFAQAKNLWMAIEVSSPTGSAFAPLAQRQRVTGAPFSMATRGISVNAAGDAKVANGNFYVPAGRLIGADNGVNTNGGRLHIQSGNDGTYDGLFLNPFPGGGNVYLGNGAGAANLICYDRVGIGTSTPATKLDVAGNIKIRTDDRLYFGAPGEDSDTIYLNRYRFAADQQVLELVLGDNPLGGVGNDSFVISTHGASGVGEQIRFQFNSDGNAYKPGGGSWSTLCDERSKNDIEPMTGTLDRLLQLKGHSYTYKPEFVENGRALPGTQIGLVAQEVETVFPDWVTTGSDGLKVVTERSTTALMVEAMRDLRNEKDAEIKALQSRLEKLEARLNAETISAK